ncbi:MAG TPA: DUF4160 domain-containing protein [Spirochaetota bacterium]|jgi:hypothetical protein|nr:MAG: hypothetical protein BWX91_01102 [Spirochaetes bacterium ADurb.Bin133]HNZ27745.1 DUF4160 domain-containing protein [Spirochaetota bacterium]HPY88833.1 DUF4160 domain-containing protein [Spirochaetota bacterium]HQB61800.1 DUF4160 domain-containing protein [Spirochaetota bacterium]
MPTLLLKNGFRFFFYANEHLPKHIHITKGDDFAKYDLERDVFVNNYFSANETNVIIEIIKENKSLFLEKWYEYFNKR